MKENIKIGNMVRILECADRKKYHEKKIGMIVAFGRNGRRFPIHEDEVFAVDFDPLHDCAAKKIKKVVYGNNRKR